MRELYTEISPDDCQAAYEKYINAHMVPLGKSAFEAGWNAALQLVAARMEYISEAAYSTRIFTEVSDERKKELGTDVDRLSAAMGRHLLHWWAEECKAGMTTAAPEPPVRNGEQNE